MRRYDGSVQGIHRVSLKKEQRQSIRKKLEQAKERVAKHREITKEKTKDRGQVR